IQKPFSRVTERSFYLVDRDGTLLAHPNDKLVFEGKNLKDVDVVKKAIASKVAQGETKFMDPESNSAMIASFAQTQYGPAVIAQVSEEVILEPARYVRREAFYITGLVLSGAVFFV